MASSFAPTIRPPGRADISIYTRPRSASCRRQSGRGHLLGAPDGRFGRSPGLPGLHDLPVRVLLDDLAVPKLEVIAAADFHMVAGRGRARERPLGYALRSAHPKVVLPVVDVRKPGKAALESLANLGLPDAPLSPRMGTARPPTKPVVREETP